MILQEQRLASLTLQQAVYRDQDQRQLIQAVVRIVALDNRFKPTRLPDDLLHALRDPERRTSRP